MSRRAHESLLILAGIALCVAGAHGQAGDGPSQVTAERLAEPGWWPTKGDSARSLYVGDGACQGCHGKIADQQETTAMYHAGMRADQANPLKGNRQLKFHEAGFTAALAIGAGGVTYTVSDSSGSAASPVTWAFGAGKNGQTYILEKDAGYIESRVSYFSRLDALDVTPGQLPEAPGGAEKALGRRMGRTEVQLCFRCHTTEAVTAKVFESEKAIPGIRCEACHGPGAEHATAMTAKDFAASAATIMNPAGLSPVDSVDFCGACHRTWADVLMQMPANPGVGNIRFQPYRLEESRCWGPNGDARITCVACHDPHQPLVRELGSYDSKCRACHSASVGAKDHVAKTTCKVATSNCVSCHMPKYELPQTHASFTDHDIRVVRDKTLDGEKQSP